MIQRWLRFSYRESVGFGTLEGDKIRAYDGNMFAAPELTRHAMSLSDVKVLMPAVPGKILAWSNSLGLPARDSAWPPELPPRYTLKMPDSYCNPNDTMRQPRGSGRLACAGVLGIVIGRACQKVTEVEAIACVFGFTCVNDVSVTDHAAGERHPVQSLPARLCAGYCPFGPVIATGLDPAMLVVRTTLDGEVRQDYPVNQMTVSVYQLVSLISLDWSLDPGDIILCRVGGSIDGLRPGGTIEVDIDGIGTLRNHFS